MTLRRRGFAALNFGGACNLSEHFSLLFSTGQANRADEQQRGLCAGIEGEQTGQNDCGQSHGRELYGLRGGCGLERRGQIGRTAPAPVMQEAGVDGFHGFDRFKRHNVPAP